MKKDRFTKISNETNELIAKNKKVLDLYTNIRFIMILALVVFVVLAIQKENIRLVAIIVSIVLFIVAFTLSIIMNKYKKIDNDLNYKKSVIRDYLSRFTNDVKSKDTGLEFAKNEYFETDLDILGNKSIFNYINFSKTPFGKKETAYLLSGSLELKDKLKERQEASQELANNLSQTLDTVSYSYQYQNLNPNNKVSDLENSLKSFDNKYSVSIIQILFGVLYLAFFITLIVLSVLKIVPPYSIFILMGAGFFLSNMIYPSSRVLASDLANARNIVKGYSDLILDISKKNYESDILKDLQKPIKLINNKALKSFNIISGFAESRNNILYQVLFDGSIMVDLYVLLFYSRWQKKYANYLREAFLSIGKIESLISISTISLVKEDSCLPVVSNKFEFKNIRHPLICESKCIPNSFEFSKRNIITGSNMSGKTTFMRSIGTNYILFLSGSNVCANSFEAPILKLFTSMKVVDDVNNNISTFYGEILRVKNIVEYIKDNKPMLVLVDEIFKGTNTHDRIIGAKSFIEKLNRDNIYSIITTHDPELCKVEDVKNYHFEEHYEDDKILFDYLIHDGIANTRNAIYLLKLAGIVDKEK
jgi:hypothetical protein